MGDGIRLRAGQRANMPQLADREPAFVRDEAALYIGTPEGNVKLAAAELEGRVDALEETARTLGETLDAHGEALESVEGVQQTRGEVLEQLQTQTGAQQETLNRLAREKLTAAALPSMAPLPEDASPSDIAAAWNALVTAMQAVGMMEK